MLRRLIHFRYYRKIVLSFVIVGVLLLCVAVSCVSILFSHITAREVGRMATLSMTQISDALERLFQGSGEAANALLKEKYAYAVMHASRLDRLKEYELLESMKKVMSGHPYIQSVGVVNGTLNRYMGTRGVYFGVEEEITGALKESETVALICRAVKKYENSDPSVRVPVITYLYRPSYQRQGRGAGCVVVDMSMDDVRQQLGNLDNGIWEDVVLADETGRILAAASGKSGFLPLSLASALDVHSEKTQGFFVADLELGKSLVSFTGVEGTRWKIIGTQPYGRMVSGFEEIRGVFLWGAVLFVLLYAVISLFLSRFIYSPLKSVRDAIGLQENVHGAKDELKEIGDAFEEYRQRARIYGWDSTPSSRELRALLLGLEPSAQESTPSRGVDEEGEEVSVMLLSVDSCSRENALYADRQLYLYILMQLSGKMMHTNQEEGRGVSVTYGGETLFVWLASVRNGTVCEEALLAAQEMQLELKKSFSLSASIAFGKPAQYGTQLKESFESARACLERRLWSGPMSLLEASRPENRERARAYPEALEGKLGDKVFSGDEEGAQECLAQFWAGLRKAPARVVSTYAQRLCLALLARGLPLADMLGEDTEPLCRVWDEMARAQQPAELHESLESLAHRIGQLARHSQETGSASLQRTVAQVQKHVLAHYGDSALSLSTLAERVSLSPSYLGQTFSRLTGTSCIDYIASVRMRSAAQQLTDSDHTIQQISAAVGIPNSSYFYTLFKKTYGMTPHQYRVSRRKKEQIESPDPKVQQEQEVGQPYQDEN